LYAPKGLPSEAIRALQGACQEAVRSERYVSATKASQQEVLYRGSDAFSKTLATEYETMGQTLRRADLKLD